MARGQYNSFNAENSQRIKTYAGSALNEVVKVADQLQGQFDLAETGIDGLKTAVAGVDPLDKDRALLNQRLQGYNAKLKDWSGRKDLENVYKDVIRTGKGFATEYQNFKQSKAAYQAHAADLQDKVSKGFISAETAQKALIMDMDNYSGLKYDEATGQYTNGFSGSTVAKEVDITEKIKKAVGDLPAYKNGHVVERDGGLYFIKQSGETERVSEARIQDAWNNAYALDPELRADINQRARLDSHMITRNLRSVNQLSPELYKEVMEQAQGREPLQVAKELIQNKLLRNTEEHMKGLANKYVYQNVKSGFEYDGLTASGQTKVAKDSIKTEIENRFAIGSPVTKGEPITMESLRSKVVGATDEFKKARETREKIQIALRQGDTSVTSQDLEDAINQEKALLDVAANNVRVMRGAQDKVAKKLGYTDFKDFKAKAGTEPKKEYGFFHMLGKSKSFGYMPEESKVVVDETSWGKFNDAVAKELKDNMSNYTTQYSEVNLLKKESDTLEDMLNNRPGAFAMYEAGSNEPQDRPVGGMDMSTIRIVPGKNGETILTGQGKDKEGKPNGVFYDIKINGSNNISRAIGSNIITEMGKTERPSPNMMKIAMNLMGVHQSQELIDLKPGAQARFTNDDGSTFAQVLMRESPVNGVKYQILNAEGKPLMVGGKTFEFADPTEAARFIAESKAADIKK